MHRDLLGVILRSRSRFAIISSAAVVLACLAIVCRSSAPYRIGVVLGSEGLAAAHAAVDAVNAAGGINGHRLELRDFGGSSTSSAQVALAVADSLASDPTVLAVIGHSNSSASLAASQVYNARHITQIAPNTTAPVYREAGPYSFRLVSSDSEQARFLADTLRGLRPSRLAIVYVNDDYGRALRQQVRAALARNAQPVSYDAPYAENDTAGRGDLVAALARRNVTTLLWIGRAYYFSAISADLRRLLPKLDVIASDGFGGQYVEDNAGGQFAGVRYVRLVDLSRTDTALQTFRAVYKSTGFTHISDDAVLSYDAVRLIAEALRATGADREDIRNWLAGVGTTHAAFHGASGSITFTPNRERQTVYSLSGGVRSGGAR